MQKVKLSPETKKEIGRNLQLAPPSQIQSLAVSLNRSVRTLIRWRDKCDEPIKKPGPKPKEITIGETLRIGRVWKNLGRPNERVVKQMVKLSLRKIRVVLARLKNLLTKKTEDRIIKNRVSIQAVAPNVITAMDGAQQKEGGKITVARDRATQETSVQTEMLNPNSSSTIRFVTRLIENNKYPLVYSFDNGPEFRSTEVMRFLEEKRIIPLYSLPRTPQHNTIAEVAVRDIKRLRAKGINLERSVKLINELIPRKSLGWQTPLQAAQKLPKLVTETLRNQFYQAARKAIDLAKLGITSARKLRMLEREAILQTLESFGLIKRTNRQMTPP